LHFWFAHFVVGVNLSSGFVVKCREMICTADNGTEFVCRSLK